MRRSILPLLLLCVLPARAQLTVNWTLRADVNAGLPSGIRVYEARRTVTRFGLSDSLRVWLVRADTNAATWRFGARIASTGTQTIGTFAAEPGVLVAMNGGYFGGGASFSLVADGGQIRAQNIGSVSRPAGTYYPTRGAMGLLQNGRFDVAWIYHVAGSVYSYPSPSPNTQAGPPQPQPSTTFPAGAAVWPVRDGMGGGPVLVEGGQKRITFEQEVFFGSGIGDEPNATLNPRSAVGYTPSGEVLMIVAEGRSSRSAGLTLSELADLFVQLGAAEALNLDGGGSSQLIAGGKTIYGGDGRSIAAAIVLGPKTTATSGTVFEFDADPASPHYRETGSWIESSNTPYFGAMRARLNAVGGGDRAVFYTRGARSAPYNVYAWWVPSSNRATNTPFTVYHNGQAVRTVRVNQADASTAGKWNLIGQFDLSAADSVVVTDDATPGGTFVVADGLRLTEMAVATEPSPAPARADLRLYPNPTAGAATLDLSATAQPREGVVYDLLGRPVARFEIPAGAALVPVSLTGLSAGVYIVRVDEARTTLVVRP